MPKTDVGQQAKDLLAASRGGCANVVEVLLAAGVPPDAEDMYGGTALYIAAERGHADVVEALLAAGASVDAETNSGNRALHIAARLGHTDVIEALLAASASRDVTTKRGVTALYLAAEWGYTRTVEVLLAAGASPGVVANDGRTAMFVALYRDSVDIAAALLAAGASPNAANNEGDTELHLAAYQGNAGAVKMLLAAGASSNIANDQGRTALSVAVSQNDTTVISLLLRARAGEDSITRAYEAGFDEEGQTIGDSPLAILREALHRYFPLSLDSVSSEDSQRSVCSDPEKASPADSVSSVSKAKEALKNESSRKIHEFIETFCRANPLDLIRKLVAFDDFSITKARLRLSKQPSETTENPNSVAPTVFSPPSAEETTASHNEEEAELPAGSSPPEPATGINTGLFLATLSHFFVEASINPEAFDSAGVRATHKYTWVINSAKEHSADIPVPMLTHPNPLVAAMINHPLIQRYMQHHLYEVWVRLCLRDGGFDLSREIVDKIYDPIGNQSHTFFDKSNEEEYSGLLIIATEILVTGVEPTKVALGALNKLFCEVKLRRVKGEHQTLQEEIAAIEGEASSGGEQPESAEALTSKQVQAAALREKGRALRHSMFFCPGSDDHAEAPGVGAAPTALSVDGAPQEDAGGPSDAAGGEYNQAMSSESAGGPGTN